jgi:hypothetical protein
MDPNFVGICVAIFLSAVISAGGIAVAIYFGLRSFTKGVSEKVETVKKEVVGELSGIKENVIKINERAEDIWQRMTAYLSGKVAGTVEVVLQNFGKTKVSAEPSITETKYIIQPEKGRFNAEMIIKLSKTSDLVKKEIELFNREPLMMNLGNILRVSLPSTDPNICVQYINFLLKWLDTYYIQALADETEKFERDIKV